MMIWFIQFLLFIGFSSFVHATVVVSNEKCAIAFKNDHSAVQFSSAVLHKHLSKYFVYPEYRSVINPEHLCTARDAIICLPDSIASNKSLVFRGTPGVDLDICNSHAIVALKALATHNSNTGLFYLQLGSDLARGSSNYGVQLLDRFAGGSCLARGNSNYGMELILGPDPGSQLAKRDSSTGLFHLNKGSVQTIDDSNAVNALDGEPIIIKIEFIEVGQFQKENSNAFVFGNKNNSNAILRLCEKIEDNSNAIVKLDNDVDPQRVNDNSNAIIKIRQDLSTVDAMIGDKLVTTGNESLLFSLFLHSQNRLIVQQNPSTSPITRLNGNGHFMQFALNRDEILEVEDNITLVLENVVLKDFQSSSVKLGTNSALVFGNSTVIEITRNQQLAMDWTFQGSAQIKGFGNQVKLGPFALESSQSSELLLRDIILTDVRDNNIRNIGDKASIAFENAEICLSRDFSITAGAFVFKHDVQVTGSHAFALQTGVTSTVCGKAILLFDTETTLCYDPPIDRRNLLFFEDESSILALNGATLKSSRTGLQLTRGVLCLDKVNELFNDGALSLSEAIQIGDGTVLGDMKLWFKPSASLDVKSGILDYQNLS